MSLQDRSLSYVVLVALVVALSLQIEHSTVNILALGYDIQVMPPRNGEEYILVYLGNRLLPMSFL